VRTFESFGSGDWTEWLEGVLAGTPVSPPAPQSAREISQDLLALYRTLSVPSAIAFASSVGELLRATPLLQNFAPRLFTLLQLAATVKPRGLDRYLDRLLREDVCRQQKLEYGRADLHSDVLSTLSRYGVDETLVDYIEQSVCSGATFEYALNGFRIAALLSTAAAGRVAPFVADLVIEENTDARLRQFSVQVLDLALRHQYQLFLEFFLDFSERESGSRMDIVARAVLLSGCTEDETKSQKMRAFQSVIHDCATAVVERLKLKRVLAVARNHRFIDKKLVERALDHCWRWSSHHAARAIPWEYVSYDDEYAPSRLMKKIDIIFNTLGDNEKFDGSEDAVVIDLLSEVSRRQRSTARELVAV
jgi:hypothetical protein